MRARQLIGNDAGKILEVPFDVFQRCVEQGTMCRVGEEPKIRGMVLDPAEPEEAEASEDGTAAVVVPEDWEDFHYTRRKELATNITGVEYDHVAEADEAIRKHLETE